MMINQPSESENILQGCLERLLSGQETIESVLRAYPDKGEELRPLLEAALWMRSQRNTFAPRPGFVRASRRRLEARIKAAKPQPLWTRLWSGLKFKPSMVQYALLLLIALAMILSLGFGATTVVLASEQAVPGEAGYAVKRVVEDTRLAFTFNLEEKAELHILYARRRLTEVQLILDTRQDLVPKTLESYQVHLDGAAGAIERLAERDPVQARQVAARLAPELAAQGLLGKMLAMTVPVNLQRDFLFFSSVATWWVEETEERIEAVEASRGGPRTRFTATSDEAESGLVIGTSTDLEPSSTPTPSATLTETPSPTPTSSFTPTPSLTASPTLTPYVTLTPTSTQAVGGGDTEPQPTQVVVPTDDDDDDEPKPTKTPKPLPEPTRRPTKDPD